ncbi:ABC transporter ATP-binding protein [Thalassotalea litorea]|uniref:ABC transporter ATP-binding protein n=1 Tax=Thalassotalea litorea TaxID=2020715 RepID=A0A5R9IPB9_9GAMM|nr:ABC transporter ATP-binding protein [Thalassotalea litorea]TLU67122.1 ABC transporter ATP-binding protein [Thalassotalea litorea]
MVLAIHQLQVSYQQQSVLQGVDLNVRESEIVCLLGASGCGKTTLLKAIAGLVSTDSGDIVINQQCVNSDNRQIAPEQRNLGMLFQEYALFPHLNVGENIAYGLRKLSKDARKERVLKMLTLVQLPDIIDKYPHQLSGGQQQRVALARALAYQPNMLLLDEPFSNIDSKVKFELIRQIRDIIKRSGVAAIFVSHSKDEAFAFADTIALMDNGKIQQTGSPKTLYQKPNSPFVARFMGSLNEIQLCHLGKENRIWLQQALHLVKAVDQNACYTTLMIRPENLSRTQTSETLHSKSHSCDLDKLWIQGKVESTTFYGKQITVNVRCHQQLVSFYLDSKQRISVGEEITLYFSSENLLLANHKNSE